MPDRRYKQIGQGLPGPRGFNIADLFTGAVPVWDGSRWQVKEFADDSDFLYDIAESYFYTAGTEVVLDLASAPSRTSYLLYSQPAQYGAGDYRHGILAVAGRYNVHGSGDPGSEGFVDTAQIINLSGYTQASFGSSEYTVTYNGGGGTPSTRIFYWRIS